VETLSSDNTAIITGASSGIGRAAALALAEKGLRLCLLARSGAALEQVAAEARRRGAHDAFGAVCDLRDEDAVRSAISSALDRFGRIDVLLNSAGLSLNGEVSGYSLDQWRTVLDTNLTGTFLTCREVLPAMKRQGRGQIINISSGAGRNGIKEMSAYCASKFGVIGFSESLALEVRNLNIRVSVLLPGSVATGFSRVARGEQPQSGEMESIGYAMTAEEVGAVIVGMLEQPPQAWMSEVVLRPLNMELRRTVEKDYRD
jgi:3-oxoacyl-[acyl-carrier protein] reductase